MARPQTIPPWRASDPCSQMPPRGEGLLRSSISTPSGFPRAFDTSKAEAFSREPRLADRAVTLASRWHALVYPVEKTILLGFPVRSGLWQEMQAAIPSVWTLTLSLGRKGLLSRCACKQALLAGFLVSSHRFGCRTGRRSG